MGLTARRAVRRQCSAAAELGLRHDLAAASRLALETVPVGSDMLHIVGALESDATRNATRAREILGLQYRGDLETYR